MMIHVLDPVYIYYIYNVIIHKYTYSQGPDSVAKSEGNQNQPNSYRMQCILYVASPENWDCHFPMFKPIMFISGWSVIPQNLMGFPMICPWCLRLAPERSRGSVWVAPGRRMAEPGWDADDLVVKSFGHTRYLFRNDKSMWDSDSDNFSSIFVWLK